MDKGEKAEAVARDPLPRFRAWLIEQSYATAAELERMESELDAEIQAAIDFALASPNPDIIELRRDVLATEY
jgi:acetoin:2,6-dichlorophenolindophenol oxidoreductase subunit alpha